MEKDITIHPDFKLNGRSYTKESLSELAITLIRDGEAHEKDLGNLILEWFDSKNYITLTTSGTTGKPKEINLSKQAMRVSALATGEFFKLQPKDKALLCLPTRYIAGKMMFVRAILLGLELDFVSPNKEPLKNNDKIYDFVAMVPLQVHHSITQIEQCKTLIVGGAKLNNQTKQLLQNMMVNVYETYGMTETITHIAAKKINEPYFTILPHVTISQNKEGCLVIEAPQIANYLIETTDIVEMPNDIQFKWIGRHDNIVNSGGVKLVPEVIEQKLAEYIPFRFFVIGKEDAHLGEKLVLVIEHTPYKLVPEAFESLEKYETPRETIFIDKFKETPTGKVLRKESVT